MCLTFLHVWAAKISPHHHTISLHFPTCKGPLWHLILNHVAHMNIQNGVFSYLSEEANKFLASEKTRLLEIRSQALEIRVLWLKF